MGFLQTFLARVFKLGTCISVRFKILRLIRQLKLESETTVSEEKKVSGLVTLLVDAQQSQFICKKKQKMGYRNKDIPEELVSDILSRLPAKDILCFRCVSKSWNAIIGSTDFIRMRHHVSIRGNHNLGIFFNYATNRFRTLHLNDGERLEISWNPPRFLPEKAHVLRHCNGLFLIEFSNYKKYRFAILNPSTRECKELPEPLMPNNCSPVLRAYGFCYESVGDDYKVVLVYSLPTYVPRFLSVFYVYSLKSNTLEQIGQYRDAYLYNSGVDVFVGGALHWVGIKKTEGKEDLNKVIISFNIITGEIRVMPTPNLPIARVGILEGCLCLSTRGDDFAEFWLMKDYDVKESWTKLFSMSQPCLIYLYSKSGTRILFTDCMGRYLLHDLTEGTTMVINHCKVINVPERAINFVENLVQLRDYRGINSDMAHGQLE